MKFTSKETEVMKALREAADRKGCGYLSEVRIANGSIESHYEIAMLLQSLEVKGAIDIWNDSKRANGDYVSDAQFGLNAECAICSAMRAHDAMVEAVRDDQHVIVCAECFAYETGE